MLVLWALGCGGTDGDRGRDTRTADADADADSDTDTDTDADADTDADTDAESGATGDTGAPALPDDGYVTVVWTEADGAAPTALLAGQVYEEEAPGVPGVVFAAPRRVEECALTLYTLTELQAGVLPTRTLQSAGTLTLTPGAAPPLQIPIDRASQYDLDLDPAALPLGGACSLSAPGASFPAFSAPDGLHLPSARTLTAPAPDFRATGDLAVRWTGGDAGELLLRLETSDPTSEDRGFLECRVGNDGEFVVPGELVDQLPAGRVSLHLEQTDTRTLVVDDRYLRLTGSVVDIVVGTRP